MSKTQDFTTQRRIGLDLCEFEWVLSDFTRLTKLHYSPIILLEDLPKQARFLRPSENPLKKTPLGFPVKRHSVWGCLGPIRGAFGTNLGPINRGFGCCFCPKCFVGLSLFLRPPPGLFKPYKKQQMVAIKAILSNLCTGQILQITVKTAESQKQGGARGAKPPQTVTPRQSVTSFPDRGQKLIRPVPVGGSRKSSRC